MKPNVTLSHKTSSIEHERELDGQTFGQSMIAVRRLYDKQIMGQVKEMASLAFGESKVSPSEYFDWQLYRDDLTLIEKKNFIGLKAMRGIWNTCNYKENWRGFMWDKLVFDATLKGFEFPVPSTLFVLKEKLFTGPVKSGSSQEDFSNYLRTCRDYPIFCKPSDSYQSLGIAAIVGVNKKLDTLTFSDGTSQEVQSFAAEAIKYCQEGYIVQKKLDQHPQLKDLCGESISTIRLLVTLGEDGACILNACWKIPAPENAADNYWRNGNKIASVDLTSGGIGRVVSGTGINMIEIDDFPLVTVPDWSKACELALAASSVLGHFPLLGWDIAITRNGPVIIEANETPDFGLHQIAEGKGMNTAALQSFITKCQKAKKTDLAKSKAKARKHFQRDFQQIRVHGDLSDKVYLKEKKRR